MKFFKNKKTKILTLSLGLSLISAGAIAGFLFSFNHKNNLGVNYQNFGSNTPEIFSNGVADIKNATISHTDRNLVEAKVSVAIEKKEPKIVSSEVIEPQPQPTLVPKPPQPVIKSNPIPTPILPTPKPTPPKVDSKKVSKKTVIIHGVPVEVYAEDPKQRILNESDISAGITNKDPFVHTLVGRIVSIEVTDKLKDAVLNNLVNDDKSGLKRFQSIFLTDDIPLEIDEIKKTNGAFNPDDFFKQNLHYWQRLMDKFIHLLKSPRVKEFLLPNAVAELEKGKQFFSENAKYAWMIKNLDYKKFTKLSSTAQKYLKEGYTATAENAYINENGELDSYSYEPAPGYNNAIVLNEKLNRERRVFHMEGYFGRNPGQIADGEYPGWSKSDVTNQYESIYNITKYDDIKVFELSKINKDGQEEKAIAIEIDAANESGYKKTLDFIKKLNDNKAIITSYRIKNMGKKDPNQAFKEIMKALPDKLPHLELFFDQNATNTASLIELENKEIKELSLFTLGNIHLPQWSINPLALKGVKWINTLDYANNYGMHNAASRIVFDTIAFEESDINNDKNDLANKYKRINDGLRMAYYVRNNERIFQGSFGSGMDPDHDEDGNSYPTRLDFSRAPSIRSLKGLIFKDIFKPSNKPRKLKNLKLFNNKQWYEISTDDLDGAQFDTVMVLGEPSSPPTRIEFSNNQETNSIKITGKNQLSSSALNNLNTLITLSGISRDIWVEEGANALQKQLEDRLYNVKIFSATTENEVFN
ncbi:putative immunoglobulin-blocking virulence protein [Metamycoplasma alkalescens]|uniref:putative immunoglobulin-blocking virulence protein n=1 Tax=Metamycoplasma alkalescens TaxID=45363 RepID=UPI003D078C1C